MRDQSFSYNLGNCSLTKSRFFLSLSFTLYKDLKVLLTLSLGLDRLKWQRLGLVRRCSMFQRNNKKRVDHHPCLTFLRSAKVCVPAHTLCPLRTESSSVIYFHPLTNFRKKLMILFSQVKVKKIKRMKRSCLTFRRAIKVSED